MVEHVTSLISAMFPMVFLKPFRDPFCQSLQSKDNVLPFQAWRHSGAYLVRRPWQHHRPLHVVYKKVWLEIEKCNKSSLGLVTTHRKFWLLPVSH